MQDFKKIAKKQLKISVILVNYKSEAYLNKCLACIFNNNKEIEIEVVVVNNDIQENLNEIKKNFPGTVCLENNKNIGFGPACNQGAEIAQGDILLFLNPDTETQSKISKIIDKFVKNDKIAIIGPRLIDEIGKIQKWTAGERVTFSKLILNNLGIYLDKKIWESLSEKEVFWVSGAAMFVRKSSFKEVGGFDEKFFMYFEDVDLCKRILEKKQKVLFYPNFEVRHLRGKSSKNKQKQKEAYYNSQDYYFRKHFGKLSEKLVKFLRKIHV